MTSSVQAGRDAYVCDLARLEGRILAAGGLLSPLRKSCLAVLAGARAPMDVEDVLEELRDRGHPAPRSTVTRFLRLLYRLDVVEIGARRSSRRFFQISCPRKTITLHCLSSGRMVQVDGATLGNAIENFVEAQGYRLAESICLAVEPASASAEGGPSPETDDRL